VSTYAVFGMSRPRAVEMARRSVPTEEGPAAYVRSLSEKEWESKVQSVADATMLSGKTVQLSDKFDAPQFAHEFLGAVRLHVKLYCVSSFDPKTHKPRYSWIDEHDSAAIERSRQLSIAGR
jgi:hypothetical protein